MEKCLIDTDILSYYFKGNENVVSNFNNYLNHFDSFNISIVTYYEIISGLKAKYANKQLNAFREFCELNNILPLTESSADISARLYAKLKNKGTIVDDIDLLIAGIAIDNDFDLVTNNTKHFNKILDLKIQNWSNSSSI